MARDNLIELGGEILRLHYTFDDREVIELMFRRADNSPGGLTMLASQHLVRNGSFLVQTAIVWAGLRHLERQDLSLKKVRELLQAEAKRKGAVQKILISVQEELMTSGVLGEVFGDDVEGESKG